MERKYQIFISSTYVDLIDERQEVTKQILNNYHFPVGMEMFAPSDKAQWEIIENTIDSSDIYILLLGYRYGSVLNIDTSNPVGGKVISYTEMEFEYAENKKKPIIVFIKEDNNLIHEIKKLEKLSEKQRCSVEIWTDAFKRISGKDYETAKIEILQSLKTGPDVLEYIYNNIYDRDQTKIDAFRSKARKKLIGQFSKDKHIDVQNAITQKIRELPSGGWVKEKQIKFTYILSRKYLTVLFGLFFFTVGTTYLISENTPLKNRLIKTNNNLFDLPLDSNFKLEFARTLPDKPSLETETASLAGRIEATKSSFSICTPSFRSLKDNWDAILAGVSKGVKFRILLMDTTESNYNVTNEHWFYNPDRAAEKLFKGNSVNAVKENIIHISSIISQIKSQKYAGTIDLRFYNRPFYYTMWIADYNRPDGIAHLALSTFDGFKPNFRVTAKSSKRLFKELNDEFNKAWEDRTDSCWVDSKIISCSPKPNK